jgi:hypothetical protein
MKTDTPRTDAHQMIDGMAHDHLWRSFAETLERELNAARAELDGFKFALKQASSIYDAVTEQRDRLTKSIEPLKYWRDISECDCSNPLPQGGCLRCDLDRILNNQ